MSFRSLPSGTFSVGGRGGRGRIEGGLSGKPVIDTSESVDEHQYQPRDDNLPHFLHSLWKFKRTRIRDRVSIYVETKKRRNVVCSRTQRVAWFPPGFLLILPVFKFWFQLSLKKKVLTHLANGIPNMPLYSFHPWDPFFFLKYFVVSLYHQIIRLFIFKAT